MVVTLFSNDDDPDDDDDDDDDAAETSDGRFRLSTLAGTFVAMTSPLPVSSPAFLVISKAGDCLWPSRMRSGVAARLLLVLSRCCVRRREDAPKKKTKGNHHHPFFHSFFILTEQSEIIEREIGDQK